MYTRLRAPLLTILFLGLATAAPSLTGLVQQAPPGSRAVRLHHPTQEVNTTFETPVTSIPQAAQLGCSRCVGAAAGCSNACSSLGCLGYRSICLCSTGEQTCTCEECDF